MSPKFMSEHCRDTVVECAFRGVSFIDYMEGRQDAHFQVPAIPIRHKWFWTYQNGIWRMTLQRITGWRNIRKRHWYCDVTYTPKRTGYWGKYY